MSQHKFGRIKCLGHLSKIDLMRRIIEDMLILKLHFKQLIIVSLFEVLF